MNTNIRNIIGEIYKITDVVQPRPLFPDTLNTTRVDGVFDVTTFTMTSSWQGAENINQARIRGLSFKASNGDEQSNPISRHATGPDIHPYSMYFVPLITY